MATHSSVLAWRIPWTEETKEIQSIGLQKVRHDWNDLAHTHSFNISPLFHANIAKNCWIFNDEKSEREIKETIPFIITSKIIKCLGINLPKETKDLYYKNSNMLIKEIKNNKSRWKDIPFYWIGRISIVKMTILLKTNYRLKAILIKLSMAFFNELEQKNYNLYENTKDTK